MKNHIVIAVVEGIKDQLCPDGVPMRSAHYRLPLSLLHTGFCQKFSRGKTEYSESIAYERLLTDHVSIKEWNAFSLWMHYLCVEGAPTLPSNANVLSDIFKENTISEDGKEFDTFAVGKYDVSELCDEFDLLTMYSLVDYVGDCDLPSYRQFLLNEEHASSQEKADKLIKRAVRVHSVITKLLNAINTGSGYNSSLVVGEFNKLCTLPEIHNVIVPVSPPII